MSAFATTQDDLVRFFDHARSGWSESEAGSALRMNAPDFSSVDWNQLSYQFRSRTFEPGPDWLAQHMLWRIFEELHAQIGDSLIDYLKTANPENLPYNFLVKFWPEQRERFFVVLRSDLNSKLSAVDPSSRLQVGLDILDQQLYWGAEEYYLFLKHNFSLIFRNLPDDANRMDFLTHALVKVSAGAETEKFRDLFERLMFENQMPAPWIRLAKVALGFNTNTYWGVNKNYGLWEVLLGATDQSPRLRFLQGVGLAFKENGNQFSLSAKASIYMNPCNILAGLRKI